MSVLDEDAAWREAYEAGCAAACGCGVDEEAEEIRLAYLRNRRVTLEENAEGPAAGRSQDGNKHP